jgi:spore coat protein A
MVQDVQAWLDDPSHNFGWILVGESDVAATSKRFDSRNGSPTAAPQLTITFQPPEKPIGACCAVDGSCGFVLDPGQACAGTYQGTGSTCTPNSCPPPIAVCCQLDATAACSMSTQADCTAAGRRWHPDQTSCAPNPCPAVLTPFVDPLPLPAVATPVAQSDSGPVEYRLSMVERRQKLHRDLPPTTVWGFDDGTTGGGTPGPTLEARTGFPIRVTWANDLRDVSGNLLESHALPVDTCVDGASTSAPRTVTHLHGGHVPSQSDGDPNATLLPGQQTTYEYPNNQGAATLWYHDHAMGITRLNVMMGLAGFYILRDDAEDALALPSGKYEIPLVIQDRSFHADGSFNYPSMWMEHFFGDTAMVNGKVWPYLAVDRGLYRFRILNGSNSRVYTLTFSPFVWFVQIGSDGGLLRSGVAKTSLTIAPGERADVIVDFSTQPAGQKVLLQNTAGAPYPNGDPANDLTNIMQFIVTSNAGPASRTLVNLRSIEALDPSTAAQTRDFLLDRADDPCGGGVWRINELGYDDITEMPRLGTTEIWRFINRSGEAHPMHLHLVQFQVLDRQPFVISDDEVVPTGNPNAPELEEQGWKDTVVVPPFQITRIIARFEDYVGRFPYHCHMLEHEDHAMMRQFETLPPCGDGGCPGSDGAVPGDAGPGSSEIPGAGGCQCGLGGPAAPDGATGGVVALFVFGLCASTRRRRRGARALLACFVVAGLLSGCSTTRNVASGDAGNHQDALAATATDGLVRDAVADAHADGLVRDAVADAHADGLVRDAVADAHADGLVRDAIADVHVDGPGDAGRSDGDGQAGLPFGATCTTDASCQSGFCASFGNGSMHCSVSCADGQVCPVGTQGSKCNGKGFCAY